MDFIHDFLKRLFYILGLEVGKRPTFFICISLIAFISLASGINKLQLNNDSEYLFTVENSQTKSDRDLIERYFSYSSVEFDPSRLTRPGRYAKLIVAPKHENQITNSATWKEVTELNTIMNSISCTYNGLSYNYSMICAKINNKCYENQILNTSKIFSNEGVMEYNMTRDPSQLKAIMLKYFISVKSFEDDLRGKEWENAVIKELNYRDEKWKMIEVSRLTFQSLTEEPKNNALSVLPYIYVTAGFIVLFTLFTCKSSDWVESKSLVGLMGIVSSALGASGACGVLGFIGVPFIGINLAVPFITLGIGLDDTFLMLSSWRKTSRREPICYRLAECYSDSAVSISITTITDILSFYIGVLSPIPSIRIFSLYAGTCIFGIFISHIFFFGAIIAINGSFEEIILNRMYSNMEFKKSEALQTANPSSLKQKLQQQNQESIKENTKLYIIEEIFSEFLYKTPVKISIMVIYLLYLSTSLYGLSQLKDGLLRENLVRYDSYMSDYFIAERKYFSRPPIEIQLVITSPLDYYSNSTQSKIFHLLEELSKDEYLADEIQENWLLHFSNYIKQNEINITNNLEFILALKNLFSQNPSLYITKDVVFNEAKTEILASRFMVQSNGISDVNKEKKLYTNIQRVLENTNDFQVAAYHPYFDFIELHITTSEQTIKLVGLAALIVMLVSLLIIPSVFGSLCVSLSVISIEVGILGFSSLLGIRLDFICLLNLIFCIGFSVDFSAHVSYSFYSCANTIPENIDRLKHTIHSLAAPIIQGTTSTLIGVVFLIFVPSYIFQSFFKIVFLVMIFSVFHALFIVPIMLSIKPIKLYRSKMYKINT